MVLNKLQELGMKDFLHFFYQIILFKGKVDTTLFIKHVDSDILIAQIYVDDIIFDSTNELLCKEFESCMQQEFEMSLC